MKVVGSIFGLNTFLKRASIFQAEAVLGVNVLLLFWHSELQNVLKVVLKGYIGKIVRD